MDSTFPRDAPPHLPQETTIVDEVEIPEKEDTTSVHSDSSAEANPFGDPANEKLGQHLEDTQEVIPPPFLDDAALQKILAGYHFKPICDPQQARNLLYNTTEVKFFNNPLAAGEHKLAKHKMREQVAATVLQARLLARAYLERSTLVIPDKLCRFDPAEKSKNDFYMSRVEYTVLRNYWKLFDACAAFLLKYLHKGTLRGLGVNSVEYQHLTDKLEESLASQITQLTERRFIILSIPRFGK